MKTAAIIAEYNPFHNGHRYQIEQTRRQTGADYILAVISGDFVQRGAPAFAPKHLRAKLALLGGVDAVIELPALYATASAEFFAQGAVDLLGQLNAIDILSFGSELGDLSLITELARFLTDNHSKLSFFANHFLKEGLSFPAAREQALRKLLSGPPCGAGSFPLSMDLACGLFSSPNNILALEYCKALYASKSPIRPFTIQRQGAGYHDAALGDSGSLIASASAIRKALSHSPASIEAYVPREIYRSLSETGLLTAPLTEDDFSALLYYKLLMEQEQGFASYLDCTGSLSDKICKNLPFFDSFTGFCTRLKSKDLTYTRISRIFIHILLNLKTPGCFLPALPDRRLPAPYARLLGFRESASPLLARIKKNSNIPLIAKLASAKRLLDSEAYRLLNSDIRCSMLYNQTASRRFGKAWLNEFQQPPIILP